MAVIKKETKEYTPAERFEIIIEGMNGNINVTELVLKYNISRDTFYSWKNALMGSLEELWGRKSCWKKENSRSN